SSAKKLVLKSCRKSMLSVSWLLITSLICWNHLSKRLSSAAPSLYFQCAANPFSAISFIRLVRICTSTHLPCGPITVVCRASYPLLLGLLSQSRNRSGDGVYSSVINEYTFQHSSFSFSGGESSRTRIAKRSYTSSKSTAFFRILFQIE